MATNVKRKKKKAEVMAEDGSMTLTGHLKELRNRLIICAVVFVVGVVVSLAYADRLIDLLTAMGRDYYEFVSITPIKDFCFLLICLKQPSSSNEICNLSFNNF